VSSGDTLTRWISAFSPTGKNQLQLGRSIFLVLYQRGQQNLRAETARFAKPL
jgi:hypothetical protein